MRAVTALAPTWVQPTQALRSQGRAGPPTGDAVGRLL